MRIRIFKNVRHRHAICLKFGERFVTLTMLGFEAKASICSKIK